MKEIKREIRINSEYETRQFGEALARELKPGDILALVGDLGTGKTTLTKYIARELGIMQAITSPTFTIICEYTEGRLPLYHFDVYRLDSGKDMLDIGCDEYFDGGGVSVVEWADKVAEILPIGCRVEIVPGYLGFVHVRDLEYKRTENVEDVVKIGDTVTIKCLGTDEKGRMNFSRKAALPRKPFRAERHEGEEAPEDEAPAEEIKEEE
jgi:tRNA threonylcarbamoyladenosine biosynthesis protein TsaE